MNSVIELGPIQFIKGDKGGRYPFCHSVFVPGTGVLIDPSSNRQVLSGLKDQVQTIWLSHWHEDHIMHLDLFRELPVLMHERDEPPLTNIDTYTYWYNLEQGRDDQIIDHWQKTLVKTFNFEPLHASGYLKDGEILNLGDVSVEVIHAPGHSPGNLAFFFVEPEILFIGDYDLTSFGPWYGDRYSDIDQIIETVGKLRRKPAKVWLTGHEKGIYRELLDSTWDDYLAVVDRREEKLYNLLTTPKTLAEIGKEWIVYGKPIEPILEFEMIEQISMQKHADRLIKRGLVSKQDGKYIRSDKL